MRWFGSGGDLRSALGTASASEFPRDFDAMALATTAADLLPKRMFMVVHEFQRVSGLRLVIMAVSGHLPPVLEPIAQLRPGARRAVSKWMRHLPKPLVRERGEVRFAAGRQPE